MTLRTYFIPLPEGFPEGMDWRGVLDHQVGKPMTSGILMSYQIHLEDGLLELTVDVGGNLS